jgi:hypothetical protein
MWSGPIIELPDWGKFAIRLPTALTEVNHRGCIAIRNFDLTTYDLDDDMKIIGEVNRLELVQRTGTDRDKNSPMWNAPGHDFDHDTKNLAKLPSDIIYAYIAEITEDGYLVHYQPDGHPECMDLTESLSEHNGILIYDASKLERVSKNELWFCTSPIEALLMVFKLSRQ